MTTIRLLSIVNRMPQVRIDLLPVVATNCELGLARPVRGTYALPCVCWCVVCLGSIRMALVLRVVPVLVSPRARPPTVPEVLVWVPE